MSIRIAVIGAGIMGADHARIVARDLPGAQLQIVCDASEARARAVGSEYGAHDIATDPMAVIRRSDVDALLIASPDDTHAPLTLAAIEAGKPVLCEKPLAPSSNACLRVIEAETKTGRQLVQIGFMRRFDPSYTEMKATLTRGDIGRAIMMHNVHRNVSAPAGFTGQMAITNSAPHEFDIVRFVLDTEYRTVSVFQPKSAGAARRVEPVFIVLETAAGQLVDIEINNDAAYGYDVRGELIGEHGTVTLAAPVHTRLNVRLQAVEHYPEDWRPRFPDAYRLQNQAWLESIENEAPSPVAASAWDGYCAARVAEAAVDALVSGSKVDMALADRPALYGS